MGTALVATMVQSGAEGKKVHPFFSRVQDSASEDPISLPQPEPTDATTPSEPAGHSRRKRQSNDVPPIEGSSTPEPKKQKREQPNGTSSLNDNITNHLIKPNAAPTPTESKSTRPAPPRSPQNPPTKRKVLRLNSKTGTLGSPPKSKPAKASTKVVTIKYGSDDTERESIGRKVAAILQAQPEPPVTPSKRRGRRPRKPHTTSTRAESAPEPLNLEPRKVEGSLLAKETHPFFTGNVKPVSIELETEPPAKVPQKSPLKRHTISMATPVSPRKPRGPPPKPAHFGSLNNPGLLRIPGAKYPAWPAQGMAHVRGDEDHLPEAPSMDVDALPSRKRKGHIMGVDPQLSVISKRLSSWGSVAQLRARTDLEEEIERYRPTQIKESGRKLRNRLRGNLHTLRQPQPMDIDDTDLDHLAEGTTSPTHPMVARLYSDLEETLSAYDRSTCESASWCHKYAPSTAGEVLQAGKEATYLKEWLEALRVQSVDTGVAGAGKQKVNPEKVPKKRRNKLDDFIVDSDEEDYELDEVPDDEVDWKGADYGQRPKTVLRPKRKDGGRMNNALVISGPHGCGKTAAVYAVAKEIGYEVFEINSGSRRSAKDLHEKIGDMTKNHLVQQHQAGGSEEEAIDKTEDDIKSGKQGTMTSFFMAEAAAPAKKSRPKTKLGTVSKLSSKSQKAQKQSLILVEEIDILFEEDKQFWTTLMTMIAQSRRPFVMTCNDESLVPMQSLALHGILRFSAPPTELAVDISLLIAAHEGHALQRAAVEGVYTSRGHDLRATITELNYWCQIGVGDRHGSGLDWFQKRWPKGSDLDEVGDTIRVISDGTYQRTMGWLPPDEIRANDYTPPEDIYRECWDSWQIAVGDWQSHDIHGFVNELTKTVTATCKLPAIEAYQEYCEAISDGDIFSCNAYASMLHENLDPGLPEMSTKTREDFTIGQKLLEADPMTSQVTLARDMHSAHAWRARSNLHSWAGSNGLAAASISSENYRWVCKKIGKHFRRSDTHLTRQDLADAFDPIAASEFSSSMLLEPSVFDRTISLIVVDVAPHVRSIVVYDEKLAEERKKLSNLLSEGGKLKRGRNTRAAYSALEGGERKSTRREKYFQGTVNPQLVMKTGGPWQLAVKQEMGLRTLESQEEQQAIKEEMMSQN